MAYVTNANSSTVTVITTSSNAVVDTIAVSQNPTALAITPQAPDQDEDGIIDSDDNCPTVFNPDQTDTDDDDVGDACDDDDGDGIPFSEDNCPDDPNSNQADVDSDAVGDTCDNCPDDSNGAQQDFDQDEVGDACDPDVDGDGILEDGDDSGSTEDNPCTGGNTVGCDDNCGAMANASQLDIDADGFGDACETGVALADSNLSGRVDGFDLVVLARAFGSVAGAPAYDPAVDLDRDGDVDGDDLAILAANFGQSV